MLVSNWMSKTLVTIGPGETFPEAVRLMREHEIGRLPVIEDGRLVGIVSDLDIKRTSLSDAPTVKGRATPDLLDEVRVSQMMTPRPHTVSVNDTIEEAALLMLSHKVGGLPVVDSMGRVVAMVTKGDIFRALVHLSGVTREGVQFAMDLPDQFGAVKRVTDVIRGFGGRIVSILTSYNQAAAGRCRAYIRSKELDRSTLAELRQELSRFGKLMYVVDNRDHLREMFTEDRQTMTLKATPETGATPPRSAGARP